MKINFDLESSPLEIKTDSVLGSEEKVRVKFLSAQGDVAGGIALQFSSVMKYWFLRCSTMLTEFDPGLPTEKIKVWRISLSRFLGERHVVVHLNGVKVLRFVPSDSNCPKDYVWSLDWSRDVKGIEFRPTDTASDLYRTAPVSGQYKY